jgi:hypothetical protein
MIVAKKKAEKAATEHYLEETLQCKDCGLARQNDFTGVCPGHREKIMVFAAALAEKEKATAAGGNGAAGVDGGAKPPTAPAAAVEPPTTAPGVSVEPPAGAVEPGEQSGEESGSGLEESAEGEAAAAGADGGAKPPTAPAAAVEPPLCKKCSASPAVGDFKHCVDCLEELKANYNREQAEKQLKIDAISAAVKELYPEIFGCVGCATAMREKRADYCDEHQGKIDAAVEKRLSRR